MNHTKVKKFEAIKKILSQHKQELREKFKVKEIGYSVLMFGENKKRRATWIFL